MPLYTVMGIEEVYDAFDEYEHANSLPPVVVDAASDEDARQKAERALNEYIEETRKGFWSSGWFVPRVVQIADASGYLVFEDRQLGRIGQDESNLLSLSSLVRSGLRRKRRLRSCFLSYSSKNEDFAEQMHQHLRGRRYACWYAPVAPEMPRQGFQDPEVIARKLGEAIRATRLLLVAVSGDSVASPWVELEVLTALDEERRQAGNRVIGLAIEPLVSVRQWAQELSLRERLLDFAEWRIPSRFAALLDGLTSHMNRCFET